MALSPAVAQTYPKETIRLIVPFPPGGNTDVTARLIANKIAGPLGQSIVVENIGGAGGTIGSANVARAKADGYNLLFGSTSTLAIAPAVNSKLSYDPQKSFTAVALVATAPHFLFVNPKLGIRSTAELIAYARANPDKFNFASPGIGTPNHLAAELFLSKAGIKAVHVPYRGGAPALSAVIAGDAQFAFDTFAVIGGPQASGQVNVLAVANSERSPLLKDVPTLAQAGVAGVEAASWNGIVAPAGVPNEVVTLLNAEVGKALQDQELLSRFIAFGIEPAPKTPAEFQAFITNEIAKWDGVAKSTGVKLD